MSMPVYVAPEQQMKDRADFARKGIARGRSVVVLRYADGICFVAENRSQALHKVSEIYDRIGFAAVGRYNEFENLRIAGIRHADMRGYSYDRADVTGRGLANAYAQLLGTIFSAGAEKPYEVEIVVAELGETAASDQIYRLTYDGSVGDEEHFAVMGGNADEIARRIAAHYSDDAPLADAIANAVAGLSGEGESLPVESLEIAVLDRTRTQPRKFRRVGEAQLTDLIGRTHPEPVAADPSAGEAPAETGA
ncbi:MAG: proteasome subunit alpha [Propionibacteriaceae bacterium]|nr:proteasome subunit alpha [Propionibacteriaceae bacterium]